MIDWNNDGKIDAEDFILTDIILGEDDDEEEKKDSSENRPNGSCMSGFLIVITIPIISIILVASLL